MYLSLKIMVTGEGSIIEHFENSHKECLYFNKYVPNHHDYHYLYTRLVIEATGKKTAL